MNEFAELFAKSKALIDNARNSMGVVVNAVTVYTSYLLGKYMIEFEQQGSERAQYGAKVLDSLSDYLTSEYGRGLFQKQSGWNEKVLFDIQRSRASNCPIGNWTIDSGSSEFSFQIELDTLSGFDDD